MSLWEFAACMDGLNEFHGNKKPGVATEMTEERLRQLGVEGLDG